MRNLASVILMTCVIGLGAPALAAESMSGHQAPAPVPAAAARAPALAGEAPRAHPTPTSMPAGDADRDRDDRHHHRRGHHRHGDFLPFDAFDEGLAPQVLVAQPDASDADLAPPAPPVPDVDRPPCRETSAGVVILRGTGCSRDTH